ncbi:unnamed protein product [Effrenium voratum]|uniref:Uncharacterized protein n=1 Tax=Effrenium voratum TaxID=2562239 RepID=A0AA36MXB1_9DINO|nr:unnamed protein product [Effrenium voratum]CAJ1437809.1 unnamed protein product [Effrenium voratum]
MVDSHAVSLIEAMEEWLSGDDFERAWRECYDMSCRGSTGRSDRNISESVLLQTAAKLHNHLPHGPLERMIPAPDTEFVRGALDAIGLEEPRRAGLEDLEHFEAALVVVYTHLAHCATMLEKEMPGMANAILSGKIDPRGA